MSSDMGLFLHPENNQLQQRRSARGLSARGADCNFAAPKSREMPDSPIFRYHPYFCRPHPGRSTGPSATPLHCNAFYRAMHYNAKRGIAIAYHVVRPSVRL